jgi:hypothetical protein
VLSNGLYVTTSWESPAGDMSSWVIDSTLSNLSNSLSPSSWYNLELPIQRGVDFIFDESVEWPFAVMVSCNSLIFAVGFAISVVLGAAGHETGVASVLVATFLTSTVMRTMSGLAFFCLNNNWIVSFRILMTTLQVIVEFRWNVSTLLNTSQILLTSVLFLLMKN